MDVRPTLEPGVRIGFFSFLPFTLQFLHADWVPPPIVGPLDLEQERGEPSLFLFKANCCRISPSPILIAQPPRNLSRALLIFPSYTTSSAI